MLMLKNYLCWKLKNGCIFIAWMGIISAFLSVMSLQNSFSHPNKFTDSPQEKHIIILTSAVLNLTNFVTSTMLLIGSKGGNHRLIMPWLVYNGFALLVTGGACILFTIYMIVRNCEFIYIFVFFIALSLALLFGFYTWVAVYSLYRNYAQRLRNAKITVIE